VEGWIYTHANSGWFNILEDIVFDQNGNLYAASGQNSQGLGAIVKFDAQGNASVFATGLQNPRALAIDGLGHLYVANRIGEVVNRLDLSTGIVQLFADLSHAVGSPRGVKTDLNQNVYVLNSNGDIRTWNSGGVGGNVAFQSGSSFSEALAFLSKTNPEPDATPPVISGLPPANCTLWPPNHKLVQVATVAATDAESGVAPGSFNVNGSSNEPFAISDILITPNVSGDFVIQLRAERLGSGNGRVYTLTATAADLAGIELLCFRRAWSLTIEANEGEQLRRLEHVARHYILNLHGSACRC
jgi:hypothetical protein